MSALNWKDPHATMPYLPIYPWLAECEGLLAVYSRPFPQAFPLTNSLQSHLFGTESRCISGTPGRTNTDCDLSVWKTSVLGAPWFVTLSPLPRHVHDDRKWRLVLDSAHGPSSFSEQTFHRDILVFQSDGQLSIFFLTRNQRSLKRAFCINFVHLFSAFLCWRCLTRKAVQLCKNLFFCFSSRVTWQDEK